MYLNAWKCDSCIRILLSGDWSISYHSTLCWHLLLPRRQTWSFPPRKHLLFPPPQENRLEGGQKWKNWCTVTIIVAHRLHYNYNRIVNHHSIYYSRCGNITKRGWRLNHTLTLSLNTNWFTEVQDQKKSSNPNFKYPILKSHLRLL